jgi:hypothetical protein
MYRPFISAIVASTLGLASVVPVNGDPLCHPKLTITDVQFSEMIPPTLERKWTAIVSVDASGCQTDSSGYFDMGFARLSETAPDIDFRERFVWAPPSVNISAVFNRDEAVDHYWVDNVSPCICRE